MSGFSLKCKLASLAGSILLLTSSLSLAAPPLPTAPKEIEEISWLLGKWDCTGNVAVATPQGKQNQSIRATYTMKKDLQGYWYTGRTESEKSKENPFPHVETDMLTFNPESKTFVRFGFDNFGDTSKSEAAHGNPADLAFTGSATAFGRPAPHSVTFQNSAKNTMNIKVLIGPKETPIVEGQYRCKKS